MKTVDASTIVTDVEVAIDEIAMNDAEFDGVQDDSERATIIESKIQDALRYVYLNATADLLEPTKTVSTGTVATNKVGKIDLPPDYVRLVYAKFDSWSKSLGESDIINWNDPAYAMLKDEYTTGTPDRPKIAMVMSGSKKYLELYKAAKDAGDNMYVGIMTDKPTGENYNIPDAVYRSVVYYIAGLLLLTYNDSRANMMFQEANALIGITNNN